MKRSNVFPQFLLIDIDGTMTTGQFLYSSNGKEYKVFGAHDNDGIKLLTGKITIRFITADKRGFKISKRRIDDMGGKLELVSEDERMNYIDKNYKLANTIYIGDGLHDVEILRKCFYGIAPKNARIEARKAARYVTPSKSGEGAVLDACLKIKNKFFQNEH